MLRDSCEISLDSLGFLGILMRYIWILRDSLRFLTILIFFSEASSDSEGFLKILERLLWILRDSWGFLRDF